MLHLDLLKSKRSTYLAPKRCLKLGGEKDISPVIGGSNQGGVFLLREELNGINSLHLQEKPHQLKWRKNVKRASATTVMKIGTQPMCAKAIRFTYYKEVMILWKKNKKSLFMKT